MACDTIIAHSNTITGSIGVVSVFPNISKLLHNLYINTDTISNGIGNPFFLDPTLARNPQNEAAFEKMTYNIYKRFLTKAAQSRKMPFEQMQTVAKGRVWLGADAANKGLVDIIGDFQSAINLMKTRIGMDANSNVSLKFLPTEKDKWTAFMKLFDTDISILGLLISNSSTNSNTSQTMNMLMIPRELQTQFMYWKTLASICEKEKAVFALPQLIELQ
jgi:protease-4